MNISEVKVWISTKDTFWLFAYVVSFLLPVGLIVNRGFMEASVAVIGLCFLFHSLRAKNWSWTDDPFIKIAIMAWGWLILVVSPLAISPAESIGVAFAWIRYILLYAALKNWVLTDRKYVVVLGKFLVFLLLLVIADTLWQYVFGVSLTGHKSDIEDRLTGPMDNVKVGIFLAKMLFPSVALFLFYAGNSLKNSLIAMAIILLTIATIMLSGERTAFASTILGLFVGGVFLAILAKPYRKVIIGLFLIAIIESIILLKTQHFVQGRTHLFLYTISNYMASEYGQLQKAGILIGLDNLWTGAGLKGYREICEKMFVSGLVTTTNLHPHNLYVEWFAETGAVGLLLFIAMVSCLLKKSLVAFFTKSNEYKIIAAFSFAALVVNFFPFMPTQSIFSNWPAILLWYSVSLIMSGLSVIKREGL